MRPWSKLVWVLAAAMLLVAGELRAETPDAREIVRRSNDTDKVGNWHAHAAMELTAEGSAPRVRESQIYVKHDRSGDARRRISFKSPADIAGTQVLIHEDSSASDRMWIYMPALKKVRRLLSRDRKESFVGTDFSYSDIASIRVDDYRHTLVKEEALDGVPCYLVESVPTGADLAAELGYSRVRSWIRTDNFVRIKAEFLDLGGQLHKVYRMMANRQVANDPPRWLNEQIEMRNVQTGHRTVIKFEQITVGDSLDDGLFTPSALETAN